MKFGSKSFRWGDYPPKWLLKEFGVALQQMGQKGEIAHAFDVGKDWAFVVMICPRVKVAELAPKLQTAFEAINAGPDAKKADDSTGTSESTSTGARAPNS